MLYWSLGLFLLGAVGGLVMATRSFQGQSIPGVLAAGHGLLVVAGLVLLILTVLAGAVPASLTAAVVVFILAALGGLYLLSFHLKKQRHPRGVIVAHASLAVAGVVLLIWSIWMPA